MQAVDRVLSQLRAAAEPTRLRLLALCARGAFCVSDLCEVLGQSQPRLSRHLKLLVEAGLLERVPEGSNAYFGLPPDADLARMILARLPEDDPQLAADRRQAVRLAAERAREASDAFRRHGADWDENRALGLPAEAIELVADRAQRQRHVVPGVAVGDREHVQVVDLLAPLLEMCGGRADHAPESLYGGISHTGSEPSLDPEMQVCREPRRPS